MKSNRKLFLFLPLLVLPVLFGCGVLSPPTQAPASTQEPSIFYTQAAMTIAAQPSPTLVATLVPTDTQLPTDTLVPTGTASPLPPTATFTLLPPSLTPTRTSAPLACNWAQFVADVTVPDGAIFSPDVDFTKTWRLKNIGSCTWTSDYDLVFVSGDAMTKKTTAPLPKSVAPGQTIDLSVKLTSPVKAGTYKGNWMLQSASGVKFGIGAKADQPFYVQIKVVPANPAYGLDFVATFCSADWRSAVGKLACPSPSSSTGGFVQMLTNPHLENRTEDEPTLWTHPNNKSDGWISGTYPDYKVKAGDHFRAWVGCLDESKGCNVMFKLQYRIGGGAATTIEKWAEVFDGSITVIDLDLSSLAGQTVQFILTVEVKGGNPVNANAFWLAPRIENVP